MRSKLGLCFRFGIENLRYLAVSSQNIHEQDQKE